jgi:hypothetical protein
MRGAGNGTKEYAVLMKWGPIEVQVWNMCLIVMRRKIDIEMKEKKTRDETPQPRWIEDCLIKD